MRGTLGEGDVDFSVDRFIPALLNAGKDVFPIIRIMGSSPLLQNAGNTRLTESFHGSGTGSIPAYTGDTVWDQNPP
jgi:hypothetical protein